MRIGLGIFLLVLGAIFTFALQVNIPGLGEYTLGLILMLAGVLTIVLSFVMGEQRRKRTTVVEDRRAPDTVVEERRTY